MDFIHSRTHFIKELSISLCIYNTCIIKNFPFSYRYRDSDPVEPGSTLSIVNEGTELRISKIKHDDIGDYTCIAKNGLQKIHHVVKVLIAGNAFSLYVTLNKKCMLLFLQRFQIVGSKSDCA